MALSSNFWLFAGVSLNDANGSDKSAAYFISICEGEELREVEDDGHEEEGEGVAQACL